MRTNMTLAGLEPGCRATRIGHPGIVLSVGRYRDGILQLGEEPAILWKPDATDIAYSEKGVWCKTKDIIRDFNDAQTARSRRLEQLFTEFGHGAGMPDEKDDEILRYALVMENIAVDQDHCYLTADTAGRAMNDAGSQVLDGWLPVGLYDLDTGKKIDLHVSSPEISVSEDQGITINELDVAEPAKAVDEDHIATAITATMTMSPDMAGFIERMLNNIALFHGVERVIISTDEIRQELS